MPADSSSAAEAAEQVDADSVSVVVPVHNEAASLRELHGELTEVFRRWERTYEIIFVDDGSTDDSGAVLDQLADSDDAVVVIHFRRNFGQTSALAAGIDQSTGAILVPLDADLQNDPADIPALVEKLEEGFDVVSGWRKDRQDRALTRTLPSRCANRLISWISGVRLHDYGCSLKAYRREVVEDVRLYGEMHRFVPIYADMQGGRITEMVVGHRPRRHGSSNYGLGRVFKVVLDLMLVKFLASYSMKPIYVFGGFGLASLGLSSAPILLSIYFKIQPDASYQKDFVETPLPVIAAVLILVGFVALLQGILAEVLMRTYFESQGKRPYLIKSIRTRSDERRSGSRGHSIPEPR